MTEPAALEKTMTEAEVSLRLAMQYIAEGDVVGDISVSLDGAHVRCGGRAVFDVVSFLAERGWRKRGASDTWQGTYQNDCFSPKIEIGAKPGKGDVRIALRNGERLFVESKKIKGGRGGEYAAMHEAIGQLITGCPRGEIPVVAVPYCEESERRANDWLDGKENSRLREIGIRIALVHRDGCVTLKK